MFLAEALIQRADMQRKIADLTGRINANTTITDDEKPAEDIHSLLKELETVSDELKTLKSRINATNSKAVNDAGESITDLIAQREDLAIRRNVYQTLANNRANNVYRRATKDDLRQSLTYDVGLMRKTADALAKEYRELDTVIQSLNWKYELE